MKITKIVVLGSISGQTKQRVDSFRSLGYSVATISETALNHAPGINYAPTFLDRVRNKLGYPKDKRGVNNQLIEAAKQQSFDLLWVEKCLCLWPQTLKKIKKLNPRAVLAWYSGDDMFARHNQSAYFRKSLPLYDWVFTTKSYNCNLNELPAMGAKNVRFIDKGFDPLMHAPVVVTEEDRARLGADVGFIGTFERERAEAMLFLAKNGITVRIWGNGWGSFARKNPHPFLKIELKPIYDQDYQKAICATKINLCFLRKINRDLQTDRTMELPACGALLMAERTDEHRRLFEENVEAIFFDANDHEELLEKVRRYLLNDAEREKIAAAGYARCYRDDYSHANQLKKMLMMFRDGNFNENSE